MLPPLKSGVSTLESGYPTLESCYPTAEGAPATEPGHFYHRIRATPPLKVLLPQNSGPSTTESELPHRNTSCSTSGIRSALPPNPSRSTSGIRSVPPPNPSRSTSGIGLSHHLIRHATWNHRANLRHLDRFNKFFCKIQKSQAVRA